MSSKYIKGKGPAYTTSLKRPFNNKKRTRGRQDQVKAEAVWKDILSRYKQIQKQEEDEGQELHGNKED